MLIIDSREKEGSKLVKLVESKARGLNIQTEKNNEKKRQKYSSHGVTIISGLL